METKQLSFGSKLVGLNFNPSGDDKVTRLKVLAAEMADIVNEEYTTKLAEKLALDEGDKDKPWDEVQLMGMIHKQSIGEILNAQMTAVKLVTFKYT